jgi:hypothetical protein
MYDLLNNMKMYQGGMDNPMRQGLLSPPMQAQMGHAGQQGGLLGMPGHSDATGSQFQPQQPQQGGGTGASDFVNQYMGQRNRSWTPMGGGGGGGMDAGSIMKMLMGMG